MRISCNQNLDKNFPKNLNDKPENYASMNTVMAAQPYSSTEHVHSSVAREKMQHLMTQISRHSSPDILHSHLDSTTVHTSSLHSSPGALRTSSLPDTPDREIVDAKRPSSVDIVPVIGNERSMREFNDMVIDSRPEKCAGSSKAPSLSPPALDDNCPRTQCTTPDWFEIFHQLASICQDSPKNLKHPTKAKVEDENHAQLARSVLANLNQLLQNRTPGGMEQMTSEHGLTENLRRNGDDAEAKHSHVNTANFSAIENLTQKDNFPFPIPPQNPMFKPNTIDSAASILALMMNQRQINSSHESPSLSNPIVNPNLLSNPATSQVNPIRDMQALFNTKAPTSRMHPPEDSQCKPMMPNFSENRGFLYQLGQQLMAMATSPTTSETLPRSSGWNANSSTFMTNPSATSTPLINPMLALINAGLFQPPSMVNPTSLLPNFPLNPMDKTSSYMNQGTIPPSPYIDRTPQTIFPPPPGNSLGGISMRGNQKYSAYYQHQRKQGLSFGFAGDSIASNRRPSSNLTPPFQCTRYGNRRFKSGLTNPAMNPLNADLRGSSRLPTSKGSIGSPGTNIFSNFRGASYKHSMANSVVNSNRSKAPLSSDVLVRPNTNIIADPVPQTSRLRDTAFLCSCGKDFESLYGFTLHMKDSGHKPKSDQSERDIPKLVRGQDMWINSETEQTREILRCMRCHQSFRNLPELTLHMMKTNHYSEIVYNDSGRLVFVNPEDQRKSNANGVHNLSSNPTPLKMSQHSGKRMLKSSPNNSERHSTDSEPTMVKRERLSNHSDMLRDTNSSRDSSSPSLSTTKENVTLATIDGTNDGKTEREPHDVPTEGTKNNPSTELLQCSTEVTKPENVAENQSLIDKPPSSLGSSVIKQIESFVESNLPPQSRCLTVKTENSSSATSQVSSPISLLDPGHTAESKKTPKEGRKRTFSGASLPLTQSDSSSPPNITLERASDTIFPQTSKWANQSTPMSPRISSTSDTSPQQTENPLSSLQKLVETTHKPNFSTPLMSSSSSSNQSISHGANQASRNISHSARITYNLQSPRSKTPTVSGDSVSPKASSDSAFPHLLSPTSETGDHSSALSALYAYVEKSSNSNQDSRERKEAVCSSPVKQHINDAQKCSEVKQSDENLLHPSFHAFYIAALSQLAAQNMSVPKDANKLGAAHCNPTQMMQNFLASFVEHSSKPTLESKPPTNVDLASSWMKMLQAFVPPAFNDTSEQTDLGSATSQNFTANHYPEVLNNPQGILREGARMLGNASSRFPSQLFPPSGSSPQTSPSANRSEMVNCNGVSPSASTSRCNPMLSVRVPTGVSNPNSIMSSIITKKAKCHFCGKPFANKGQVRLHISKNKCPCLLQRSCHVAALAAAFGSESRGVPCNLPAPGKLNQMGQINTRKGDSGFGMTQTTSDSPASTDNSTDKPSALSLLKERFQNFDLASLRSASSHHESLMPPLTSQAGKEPNVSSSRATDTVISLPSEFSRSDPDMTELANITAATNAGHLAAMALLAQTLVQLSSGQTAKFPETSSANSLISSESQNSNRDGNIAATMATPNGLNWDWLLAQAQFAKHLSAMNGTGTLSEPTEKESPISPTPSECHGANTPNSLV